MATNTGKRLEGAIAIVTGGAQGFGKAIVETFVAHGANVVVMDLSFKEDGAPMPINGSKEGGAVQLKANVTSREDWQKAVGRPDLWTQRHECSCSCSHPSAHLTRSSCVIHRSEVRRL